MARRSGLRAAIDILDGIDDIHFAELTSADVVRHRLVSEIVDAYAKSEEPGADEPGGAAGLRQPSAKVTRVSIEVSNESGIDVSEEELVSVARFVIRKMNVNPAAELSMVLLDTAAMADLHMRWMDLPGPTDVMSFPMDELEPGGRPDAPEPGPSMLGDIVLCPEFAADQATAAGHTLGQELALLTVHGVLHLLGYDHAEPDEEKEMFALQRQLLEEWVADQVEAYHQDRQSEKDRRLLDKSRYFDEP